MRLFYFERLIRELPCVRTPRLLQCKLMVRLGLSCDESAGLDSHAALIISIGPSFD